jgi:Family of unknown function (DUF6527)
MNPVAREVTVSYKGQKALREVLVFCPGCEMAHPFTVEVFHNYTGRGNGRPEPTWQWDGNLESPTFSPSMLAHGSVHLCEGEHPPALCDDPDICEEDSHRIGWVIDDQVVWRMQDPPEDVERVLGHVQPHTREPAWGNCHSFLKDGRWEFLSDSAHHLAGQTVDMVPLPDWLMGR